MRDLTVIRFIFMPRKYSLDDENEKQKKWESIKRLSILAHAWVYRQKSPAESPPEPVISHAEINRKKSHRLTGVQWLDLNRDHLFLDLESRLILDSAFIQLTVMKKGRTKEEDCQSTWGQLRSFLQEFSLADHGNISCMGEMTCYYAEPENWKHAHSLLHLPGDRLQRNSDQDLSFGLLTYHNNLETGPAVFVLAKNDKKHMASVDTFVTYILPRLGLSLLKIESEYNCHESDRMSHMERDEISLARHLERVPKRGNLRYLEKRILRISELESRLVEDLGMMNQRIITMQINLKNIERLLKDPVFEGQYDGMRRMFCEDCDLAIEQTQVDLNYFNARKEEAETSLQALHTFVEVNRGKMERILVIIIGLVGMVLALIDGFSEDIPLQGKRIITGAGILAGIVIGIWGFLDLRFGFNRKKENP